MNNKMLSRISALGALGILLLGSVPAAMADHWRDGNRGWGHGRHWNRGNHYGWRKHHNNWRNNVNWNNNWNNNWYNNNNWDWRNNNNGYWGRPIGTRFYQR